MSEFRRRIMIAASSSYYIQDGLIFQLDGINKGDNPNGWTELVNNFVFPYNEHMFVENDGVVFESGNTCGIVSDFEFPLSGQIEVVCEKTNSNSFVICTAKSNNLMFSFYSQYCICVTATANKTIPIRDIPNNTINSFSYNTAKQSINNIQTISSVNNRFGINTNMITLGYRQTISSYGYIGKICSIRVYNRQLTDGEVAHNYNVDRVRFRLTS